MSTPVKRIPLAGMIATNGKSVIDRAALETRRKAEHTAVTPEIEEVEQALREAQFRHKYVLPLFSVGDALKPQPPIEWRIDGLAETGGVMGVFGAPGTGKTYCMTDMAVCVALGEDWLGHKTKQCKVLWIDEDSGRRRLLRRLGDVARGHQAPADTPLEVLSLAGVNILLEEGAAELQRLIIERGAGLVVLDTLADVCGGAKIVSPDEMLPVLQALRRIAEETGALIVFLHHTNKGGEFLGAITIAGKADLLLQLEKSGDVGTFTSQKARDSGEVKFAAQMNFYTESHEFFLTVADVEGMDRAKRIAAMGSSARHVYTHLQENTQGTIADMVDELHEKGAVRKAVERLQAAKIVRHLNKHEQGRPGLYALEGQAQNG